VKLAKSVAISATALLLAGCTVPTDPFVEIVNQAVAEQPSFEATGEMASGCVGFTIICAQPMYEPLYMASGDADVKTVCAETVVLARKLGADAYSGNNEDPYKIGTVNSKELVEFCVEGLAKPLSYGEELIYQGISFYDDGSDDGFGKFISLSRRPETEKADYLLQISFSKDLNRVGPFRFGNSKPKHRTQADLDAAFDQIQIATETMKVANPLLGQPEAEAIKKIEDAGYTWVIIDRDGKELTHDETYTPTRIRLTVREGMIYDAVAG
jgi:hypothetical protein